MGDEGAEAAVKDLFEKTDFNEDGVVSKRELVGLMVDGGKAIMKEIGEERKRQAEELKR